MSVFVPMLVAANGLIGVHPYYGGGARSSVGLAMIAASIAFVLCVGRRVPGFSVLRCLAAVGCAALVLEGAAFLHMRDVGLVPVARLVGLLKPLTGMTLLADGSAGIRSHEGALVIRPTLDKMGLPFLAVAAALLVTALPMAVGQVVRIMLVVSCLALWRFALVTHFFVDQFGPGSSHMPSPLLAYGNWVLDVVSALVMSVFTVKVMERVHAK